MRSIATYPLAALCGLAMIVALFLKWVQVPPELLGLLGGGQLSVDGVATADIQTGFGPLDILEAPGFTLEGMLQEPMGIAVAASLLLAAAVAILGFLGGSVPRLFAILGGVLPFAIVGWGYFQMQDQVAQFGGLPSLSDITGGEGGISAAFSEISPYVGMGLYAYFGGALLLLLLGIFSPSKREAY